MQAKTDLIETHIAALPITAAERREALAYVAAGGAIAGFLIAVANGFNGAPALKAPYRDLPAQ